MSRPKLTSSLVPLAFIGAFFLATTYGHTIRRNQSESQRGSDDSWMHAGAKYKGTVPKISTRAGENGTRSEAEEHEKYWFENGQDALRGSLRKTKIEAVAKNLIIFIGDGMSISTVTASRIYKGQLKGQPGEEGSLYFESFPYMALSKTFCSDSQVADSACSATAYLCGSKSNIGTIGVSPRVTLNDCIGQMNPDNQLKSILTWAQLEGKSTGVVTTTRITHASPAGNYAHISHRDFENDAKMRELGGDPDTCDDIAEQLILSKPGVDINVILGGGRRQFVPVAVTDPESGEPGYRTDGKNLIETWTDRLDERRGSYVTGRDQLLAVDTLRTDYLLGLFAPSHLEYKQEQAANDDPSLAEMVQVAIEILSRNPKGFFLFVEGGRIDHAHHDNEAHRALVETLELDEGVKTADMLTEDEDTLIVVTADHSHVMTINGYSDRGHDILQRSNEVDEVGMPYTTLSYTNGPGYRPPVTAEGGTCHRVDITNDPFGDLEYKREAMVHLDSETHAGDDVEIFAKGPFAHLYSGVQMQSYIPYVMAYASCIGEGLRFCT